MRHTIRAFSKAIVLLLAALSYHLTCLIQIDPRQISLIEEGKKRAPPAPPAVYLRVKSGRLTLICAQNTVFSVRPREYDLL